jgi:hypothetical protein
LTLLIIRVSREDFLKSIKILLRVMIEGISNALMYLSMLKGAVGRVL